MQSNTVYAIIPARAGSKGVPGKNIRPLAGYPLLAYSIVAAKLCPAIQRVVVSTDSPEIAVIAKSFGAEVPFLRPAAISLDHSTDLEFFCHALEWFDQQEHARPEFLVHLRPTTPLRNPALLAEAVRALCAAPEATSLRSGHQAPESPFKWFRRDDAGYFHSLVGAALDSLNRPRQEYPAAYVPDGYVDVLRGDHILRHRELYGPKILGFESPCCVEVDSLREFELLEFMIARDGSPLLDHLKSRFLAAERPA